MCVCVSVPLFSSSRKARTLLKISFTAAVFLPPPAPPSSALPGNGADFEEQIRDQWELTEADAHPPQREGSIPRRKHELILLVS